MNGAEGSIPPSPPTDEWIPETRRLLVAAVRRSCPAWLADQAEDIVQTALVQLLDMQRRGGGNPAWSPSYVRKVAYHATVDEIRRRFRRKETPLEEESLPTTAGHADERARALEIHSGIRSCLGHMLAPRRLAVVCYLEGYSVPEAARFLGWTVKKVEHLVLRGLRDLRECLSEKGLKP
jgi:RNA polymerase sigma factor (sigma-70 family)